MTETLTVFNTADDLFGYIDARLRMDIRNALADFGNTGCGPFSFESPIPSVDTSDDAIDVITSFLRISLQNDDVKRLTEDVLSDGIIVDAMVRLANDLFIGAYEYYMKKVFGKDRIKIDE